jgi:hypothetical protein
MAVRGRCGCRNSPLGFFVAGNGKEGLVPGGTRQTERPEITALHLHCITFKLGKLYFWATDSLALKVPNAFDTREWVQRFLQLAL